MCEEAEKHYKEALQIIADTKIPTILVSGYAWLTSNTHVVIKVMVAVVKMVLT